MLVVIADDADLTPLATAHADCRVTPRASIVVPMCFSPMSAARTSDEHATGEIADQVCDGPATPFIVVGGRICTTISTRFA